MSYKFKCEQCGREGEADKPRKYCSKSCSNRGRAYSRFCVPGMARCGRCKEVKPLDEFPPSTAHRQRGYKGRTYCRACSREYDRKHAKKTTHRYSLSRCRAKGKGRTWRLTQEEHKALLTMPCHYCGGQLGSTGSGLDRIDNAPEYSQETAVPCCGLCNRVKGDCLTYEEMLLLAPTLRQIRLAREEAGVEWVGSFGKKAHAIN